MASQLYNKITLRSPPASDTSGPKTYRGFSTVSAETENHHLYDLKLIQQDLLNHFHVRQGERLMNPKFGTVIWDLLFEPMTEDVKQLILTNVNQIMNFDPRVIANQITVTSYESGIQIECMLTYLPYNVTQAMQLRFDQQNGLLAQ
jgi:phage baseplate assembly protein W